MSTAHPAITAEEEAESAVAEFLQMRAAILGRLSPEALRCVAAIFERRMEERSPKQKKGCSAQDLSLISDMSVITELSEAPSGKLDMLV